MLARVVSLSTVDEWILHIRQIAAQSHKRSLGVLGYGSLHVLTNNPHMPTAGLVTGHFRHVNRLAK